jgi:hypothetical protein
LTTDAADNAITNSLNKNSSTIHQKKKKFFFLKTITSTM